MHRYSGECDSGAPLLFWCDRRAGLRPPSSAGFELDLRRGPKQIQESTIDTSVAFLSGRWKSIANAEIPFDDLPGGWQAELGTLELPN